MRTSTALVVLISATFGILAQTPPKVKTVPIKSTSPTSGKEMFIAYCAACHGPEGRGNGPAASALKKPPTDLTRLAANNGGKYPDLKVADILSAKDVPAHGSQEMPVWGNLFKTLGSGTNDQVQLRITNLTSYIKSIQAR